MACVGTVLLAHHIFTIEVVLLQRLTNDLGTSVIPESEFELNTYLSTVNFIFLHINDSGRRHCQRC